MAARKEWKLKMPKGRLSSLYLKPLDDQKICRCSYTASDFSWLSHYITTNAFWKTLRLIDHE
jgi:hypothetical protein